MAETPAAKLSLSNPRSCFGGLAGADAGSPMYSWATSAPVTEPVLVTVHVIVATVSKRSARPPLMIPAVAGPDAAVLVIWRPEKLKLV